MNEYPEYDKIDYRGFSIKINYDECPLDPRDPAYQDNFGKMFCMHSGYDLGDKHREKNLSELIYNLLSGDHVTSEQIHDDYEDMSDREFVGKYYKVALRHYIMIPLYLLDHSGLRMSTGNFRGCDPGGWDSGQVGIIYVGKQVVKNEFSRKNWSKFLERKAINLLEGEVAEYDNYLSGAVFGWVVEGPDGEQVDDPCWGYYGDPDKEPVEEAKSQIDWLCHEMPYTISKQLFPLELAEV